MCKDVKVMNQKFYMRFPAILLLTVFLISLAACSSESNDKNLKEAFAEFQSDKCNGDVFYTSRGTEMVISELAKEVSDSPKVVFTVFIGNEGNIYEQEYQWMNLTPDEKKADLKECGEMVIEYANSQNWDNDYYLYITTSGLYAPDCDVVYDYENNWLYVPEVEETYIEMYNQFDTLSESTISETQAGRTFLIENGLAHEQHGEIEIDYPDACQSYSRRTRS